MNPINSLAFDLHSVKLIGSNSENAALSNSNTPTLNNTAPLQRPSTVMDSIGIQRVPSPFLPVKNVINEGSTVPVNVRDAEITGPTLQIPVNQENNSTFSATSSNLHMSASSSSITNMPSKALPNMGSYIYNPTGLFSNVGNQPPPPGIESQWKYIDSNGNIQGPFGTNNMSQWYQGGYFTPTLQICRLATSLDPFGVNDRFITLGELTTLVNNYQDPFSIFDFIVIKALNGASLVTPMLSENQKVDSKNLKSTANVHSDDFTYEEILGLKFADGSYYHETQVWVPVNGRHVTKVDHILNNSRRPASAAAPIRSEQTVPPNEGKASSHKRRTTLNGHDAPLDTHGTSSNPTSEEERMVEIATEEGEEFRRAEEKHNSPDQVRPEVEEVDGKDVLPNSEKLKNNSTSPMTSEEQKRFAKAELMAQKLLEEQQRQEEEKKRREEQRILKKEKKLKQKQKKEEEKLKKKKKEEEKSEKEKQQELLNNALTGNTDISSPAENAASSLATNLAPWANKQTEDAVFNQISSAFEDLKKEIPSKREKKPNRTQLNREQALKLQKEILGSTQASKTSHTGPAWGVKPQQPIKLGIKEELMKDLDNTKGQPTINKINLGMNDDDKSDSTFIEEQKKLWEQVQKKTKKSNRVTTLDDFISRTPSPSSSISNSSNTTNAWTMVPPKSTGNALSTSSAAVNQPRPHITPDKQRSSGGIPATTKGKLNGKSKQIGSSTSIPTLKARQVKPSRISAYPGNSSVSKRQEFLKWCRSQLRLNTGVQSDNVLEMLLSLPPGSESKEIIADTIYSYSSTMDGRRFATDFVKKRLECEEQINDPLSWSEVLAMPEGSSEDWEFQVVGKKKGKRF